MKSMAEQILSHQSARDCFAASGEPPDAFLGHRGEIGWVADHFLAVHPVGGFERYTTVNLPESHVDEAVDASGFCVIASWTLRMTAETT